MVPGSGNNVTSDMTSWSVVVLPDVFQRPGKLLYFSAFFVNTNPVYVQIWRATSTSDQLTLVYNQKVFPQTVNQVETVS